MTMRAKLLLSASVALGFTAPAVAAAPVAAPPAGTTTSTGGTVSTGTLNVTNVVSNVTGTPAGGQTTTTTVQSGTQDTTLSGGVINSSVTNSGNTYTLVGTAGGSSTLNAAQTTTTITTYNTATNPPSATGSSTTSGAIVTSGTATVSAITVAANTTNTNSSGGILYAANVNTTGSITGNTRPVTENDVIVTTSGLTYATYAGTATYNGSTVAVVMGTTPTASTSVNASGLTTTGSVSAASMSTSSLNMNGGKITNLGAGTAATDAVNKGQLDTAIAGVNTSLSALTANVGTLSALVDSNRKRSDAGIATAVALSGGTFLPDKKINLTANVGAFRDEVAVSAQLGVLVSPNVALNAGVATSLHSYGGTAVRGGVTFGF